ncbi:cytidylyltransferase domain-containing protein [Aeromonas veronii]|uniref:cytidylyltransferase domain-containing protein n=1 Tax=Aeromonas veronii TaxID=654 RepID=UPI00366DB56C
MTLKKIAIIPARSGSKGLPNKNILMLLDKPLIAYTIEAAIESGVFARVIVSTDSLEYKKIAERYGAEVIVREASLASDTATSFMVIQDVLNKTTGYDYFVLLQPTSPFRSAKHIQEAVSVFERKSDFNYLVSVTESEKSPDLIKPVDNDQSLKYFDLDFSSYRRQNKKQYTPNGAIFIGKIQPYLAKKHFFGADSLAYLMSKTDSVDIDDKFDFELAICIQTQKNKKKILKNNILKRISEKLNVMKTTAPITLIGHSLFDHWDVTRINNLPVNNFGIAGISTKEYLDLVINKNFIQRVGDKVILFAGTNDIVIENWHPESTYGWVLELVRHLSLLNSNIKVFLLSTPPVRGRIDRNNSSILQLNQYLADKVKTMSHVQWVELSSAFYDEFGNLPAKFTYDGLHFTSEAYQQLEIELSELLK